MLRMILAAVLAIGLSSAANADLPREPGIEGVIESQIEAFQADDFAQAFTYASPTIKGYFGTAERFGAMVRNGYPMVYRPAETRFLELREINGVRWQKVQIRDQAGTVHILDYQMIPTDDGGWQINGVQVLRAPGIGV
ncbi:DUF4864 domain-containing protein [Aliiroseovarius sp. YM-037]|uniref:DUF4864 domain-containing protein n=1 Tax=Aliiroseovarius sp. YM-037 TaxID=3341728 RepID=UPI003A804F5E